MSTKTTGLSALVLLMSGCAAMPLHDPATLAATHIAMGLDELAGCPLKLSESSGRAADPELCKGALTQKEINRE